MQTKDGYPYAIVLRYSISGAVSVVWTYLELLKKLLLALTNQAARTGAPWR